MAESRKLFGIQDKYNHYCHSSCDYFFSLLNGIIVDSWSNDVLSYRVVIGYVALLNLVAGIILVIWNVSNGEILFSFFLSDTADSIAAILYSWANIICSNNSQHRTLTEYNEHVGKHICCLGSIVCLENCR